ncbi:uncharacterized protein LAJ45_05918 [Morchella importuna]|uniref:uncharacterized protein n=1 Tax=Morchella importuna TaxID=1174673 RepID=UPI001E8CCD37|nr:uncharacterized protein LAJ45_05918 [Morchella importuna]KAH8150231.1 hypothetical protein LAJ45_05918 [Morchella importuna]
MCEICGWGDPDYVWGISSDGTLILIQDCKFCDRFLFESPGTLSRSEDLSDLRNRVALVLINRKRPLEALNFCLSSLNRASPACSTHPNYNPDLAFLDITHYKKSDIDPNSAPPLNLQPYKHPMILYTLTLASFILYGSSKFSLFCLRRAYHSNTYIYQALSTGRTTISYHQNKLRSQLTFYLMYKRVWDVPGMKEWLVESEGEVKKKACDAIGCGKVEETVGALRLCNGCREWWYCGTECQKRDWKRGGHKKLCKETKTAATKEKEIEDLLLGARR